MSRWQRSGAWAIVPALLLGCEATSASLLSPYRGARMTFAPLAASSSAPIAGAAADGGASADPSSRPTPQARGGGGPGAATEAGIGRGRVLGLADGQLEPRPLAGATVSTSDGRSITTDQQGRFNWADGWPEDGTWTVRHPGFRTSTIVGLPPTPDLTLHLKTHAGFTRPDPSPPEQRFVAEGRVLDGNGQGLADVILLLSAPDGSYAAPTTTAADGRFQMHVVAHGDAVRAATIVALDRDQDAWMGAATGLAIASGETEIDFDPATATRDPLVMRPTTHRLDVAVDDAGTGLPARVFVDLAFPGSNGRLLLFGHENSVRLAALPGARFGVEVEAADPTRSRQSVFVQHDLPIDFTTAQTSFTARLLQPPTVSPLARSASHTEVAWEAVADARGYEVRLNSLSRRTEEWEGFTTGTFLRFGVAPEALAGGYALEVVAWDDPAISPRQVASTGRQLRLNAPSSRHRWASSEVRLTW